MGQTTEVHAGVVDPVESFYDRLAPDYDAMTTFEKRFVQEEPFFKLLVQRYRIASALDAGSGTGFHSIVLARLGVAVTAVDLSSRMLDELKKHALESGLNVRTVQAGFAELPMKAPGPYDALFSMGNTLAHLLTRDQLGVALHAFGRVLSPGGILFTQVLNYDRILQTRPEVQNVKETSRGVFTRSYQYLGNTIRFSIARRPPGPVQGEEEVQSVELRPVLPAEHFDLLKEAGFEDIQAFGSIAMEPFVPSASKDFVVLARRQEPGAVERNTAR